MFMIKLLYEWLFLTHNSFVVKHVFKIKMLGFNNYSNFYVYSQQ